MKQYTDFDDMMKDLQGITYAEAVEMKLSEGLLCLNDIERTKHDVYSIEDFNGWASIFACHAVNDMVREIAQKHDLQIVTYSIGDAFSYSTGMHFVNREKYMFCRSKDEAFCEEEMEELDEEE